MIMIGVDHDEEDVVEHRERVAAVEPPGNRGGVPVVEAATIYVARPLEPDRGLLFAALQGIMDRASYTNFGVLHRQLQAALCKHLICDSLALFNNGTQALCTAFRALNIRGEVVTTPFTFPATPHAVEWAGATPIFCDVESTYMTIDPAAIEAAITPRTEAILGVHVYGLPCDVDAIAAIAAKHHLAVVYDAAHAFGTCLRDLPIHRFGDASMLSFHATKLFHCGEGGALVTRDMALAASIALLCNFGIRDEFHVDLAGSNGKMSEMQAALGLAVLPRVAAEYETRRQLASHYRSLFDDWPQIEVQQQRPQATDSMQYFPVRFISEAMRDRAFQVLRNHNVFARKYFFPLCSAAAHYAPRWAHGQFPVAERCSERVLCLPLHSGVSLDRALGIATLLKRVAQSDVAV